MTTTAVNEWVVTDALRHLAQKYPSRSAFGAEVAATLAAWLHLHPYTESHAAFAAHEQSPSPLAPDGEASALLALAEKATPGPWEVGAMADGGFAPDDLAGDKFVVAAPNATPSRPRAIRCAAITGVTDGPNAGQSEADARYIAACSPERIIALLTTLTARTAALAKAEARVTEAENLLNRVYTMQHGSGPVPVNGWFFLECMARQEDTRAALASASPEPTTEPT